MNISLKETEHHRTFPLSQSSNSWELAAALGSILLILITLLYWIYDRLVGVSIIKLG
ncbi:hypothetical protein [Aliamphritea spongicola]|uniref:hypothetical protein n=1 Tax=Aliamphritea spongicola TaxID=707589 RepID=UPI00196AC7B7|nr:hypothetical protein [Aliamphritea spongicola]MBN3563897.1 hypothetical protein [Aliamphritea spongicola]